MEILTVKKWIKKWDILEEIVQNQIQKCRFNKLDQNMKLFDEEFDGNSEFKSSQEMNQKVNLKD